MRCRVIENVVVVEDGINIGGDKVSELVCSYSYFEVNINDEAEEEDFISGIKNGNRYGPEGEWLVITHGTGDMSIFG